MWYGEDLGDRSEQDNAGETCVDVYLLRQTFLPVIFPIKRYI